MALFRGCHLADCQFCCRVIALAGNRLFAAIFICAGLGTASPCCHLRSYHAAALRLVNQFFPEPVKARGHALYSSTSFGIEGSLGLFLSGVAWESLGSTLIFSLAALTALLGAFASIQLWRWEK